ncbi:MAG: PEGA domain-containing protein [Daejeonella sp.]
MKTILSVSALAVSLLLTSCATVFTGTKQTVQINSTPPGATVEVDGIAKGTTPVAIELKKGFNGQSITLKKAGFEPTTFQPKTTLHPIALLNFAGLVGWIIDASTGAMMKYEPKFYDVKLGSGSNK